MKPKILKRTKKQTGTTTYKADVKRKALSPGKRRSKNGNIYYENRRNRSDRNRNVRY